MDLLLTHGFFLNEDEKEQQVMRPYSPLGLLYLASYLRSKGFDVEVYDSTFGDRSTLERLLEDHAPATLGVYANLLTRGSAVRIIEAAKLRGWRVVAGGPEPANYAAEYLAAGADCVVEGEGERTLEELLSGAPPETIPGLHLPGGRFTGAREQIADLDALPFPDRSRIDVGAYLAAWREAHGYGSLNLICARGCPYHCRWCSHSVYGKTHRRRSPANVADEVEVMLRDYAPERLWMADDVFTIHPGWLRKYRDEIVRRGLRRPFECITRADRLDEQSADALADLGAFRVWIGSESGSQRILDAMRRGVTVEQVRRAVRLLRERGIETGMFLMWGYQGEQIDDIEATVAHVKACLPDVVLTTVSYPIKGTDYFSEVEGKVVRNGSAWRESTDRDVAIRGRCSRAFYSFADKLLHAATPQEAAEARRGLRIHAMESEA